jgi:hypothetical protein
MTTTAEKLKPRLWELKNLIRAIEAAGVTLWSWDRRAYVQLPRDWAGRRVLRIVLVLIKRHDEHQ